MKNSIKVTTFNDSDDEEENNRNTVQIQKIDDLSTFKQYIIEKSEA